MSLKASCAVLILATASCSGTDGQPMVGSGALIGGLGGAGAGAMLGGKQPMMATLIGAGVGGLLGQMVQNLSASQQDKRQVALQQAAAGPTGSSSAWAAPENTAATGSAAKVTHAKYVNKGVALNKQGQSCSKVLETITLPDGKTGTSEELVCPT